MLAQLLGLLAPPRCLACGAGVAAAARLCAGCRAELPWIAAPCARCGLPRPCTPCPAAGAGFSSAWAPVALEGPARALVHALKFAGRTAAADVMAAQIVANAPAPLLGGAGAVVPVPADPARRRARGFDHARLLARAVCRRAQLPLLDALSRTDRGARQLGAGRAQRRRAVEVAARRPVSGFVLLVDDVHTTGATLDACARALRVAGAGDVRAVTYARTLP